jgi:hypothetical protein
MTKEEMIALYQEGLSVRAVAQKAAVSHTIVWRTLTKAGINLRPKALALRNWYGKGPNCESSRLRAEAARWLASRYSKDQVKTILRADAEWLDKVLGTTDE